MLTNQSIDETQNTPNEEEEMTPEERAMVEMVEGEQAQSNGLNLQNFEGDSSSSKNHDDEEKDLSAVYDVPVVVSAILGKTKMPVNQLLKLGRGAVVELDSRVGEPIDILVNSRLVARGEVIVMDDNKLGITMTEIIKSDRT